LPFPERLRRDSPRKAKSDRIDIPHSVAQAELQMIAPHHADTPLYPEPAAPEDGSRVSESKGPRVAQKVVKLVIRGREGDLQIPAQDGMRRHTAQLPLHPLVEGGAEGRELPDAEIHPGCLPVPAEAEEMGRAGAERLHQVNRGNRTCTPPPLL